jgi:hypothetical protein
MPSYLPKKVNNSVDDLCYIEKTEYDINDHESYYASKSRLTNHNFFSLVEGLNAGVNEPDVTLFREAVRKAFTRYPRIPNVPHIFLIGDSTGNQIGPVVAKSLERAYTFSNVYVSSEVWGPIFSNGYNKLVYLNAVLDIVVELMINDADAFVVSFRYEIFKEKKSEDGTLSLVRALEIARQKFSSNTRIIVLEAPVDLPDRGYHWLLPSRKDNLGAIEATRKAGQRGIFYEEFKKFAESNENTFFLTLAADMFCKDGYCGPWVPGTRSLGFWDAYHLTNTGAFYLWPFFCDKFEEMGLFDLS